MGVHAKVLDLQIEVIGLKEEVEGKICQARGRIPGKIIAIRGATCQTEGKASS